MLRRKTGLQYYSRQGKSNFYHGLDLPSDTPIIGLSKKLKKVSFLKLRSFTEFIKELKLRLHIINSKQLPNFKTYTSNLYTNATIKYFHLFS